MFESLERKFSIMKKTLIRAFAICAIAGAMTCQRANAQQSTEFQRFIEVTGTAEKEVEPDLFYLRININEDDSKGRKSLESQEKMMIAQLKSIGVDCDAQLTRLSLNSSYYSKKANRASADYQLKLTSTTQLAKAWQKLDELGVSSVSFTKAEYSAIESLKDEVRQMATQNAKHQAETMANAIGQSIGKCVYLSGGYVSSPNVYAQPRLYKAMAANSLSDYAEAESDDLSFNKIKVSANVSAKFILK